MKKHYSIYIGRNGRHKYRIKFRWYRQITTTNERKLIESCEYEGIKVRSSRKNLPTTWDDVRIARFWGRSWKDFTKKRKQYM